MVRTLAQTRTTALVLVLIFFLVPAVTYVRAQDPGEPESWSKTSFQQFEEVAPGGTLRVVNLHGNVYARFGGYERKAEILGVYQRLDTDLPKLALEVSRVGQDVVIGVGCSAEGPVPCNEARPEPRRDRIDIVVFVPLDVPLDVRTEADLIAAKGVRSDISASSIKGDIRMKSVSGRLRAKTLRGAITAELVTGATTESQSLATETGDIEVWLGEDANATVRLATSGEISTDFSIDIEHRRFEEPGKLGVAAVGEGGPELSLQSKRGRVRLFRQQLNFRPDPELAGS